MSAKNILITGLPGVGKTTVFMKLIKELERIYGAGPGTPGSGTSCSDSAGPGIAGFYTREIRQDGKRTGFELLSLDGKKLLLAHVDIRSTHRVGRYGVDLEGFERILSSLDLLNAPPPIVLIDEIGKMECFSTEFTKLVENLFDSVKTVVATVAAHGSGFTQGVKKREDCDIVVVRRGNRNELPAALAEKIHRIQKHR
jgi:nucleoside-triphosphatase